MSTKLSAEAPLAGRRVLDLANEFGQLGARFLADLGADVIKVEPREGDAVRSLGPFFRGEPQDDHSLVWWTLNAGKRSVTCDLRRERGRELVLALAAQSDVVILATGTRARLEPGPVEAANPSAVVVTVSGFADDGPTSGWLATDLVAVSAGGLMAEPAGPDVPPRRSSVPRGLVQVNIQVALQALQGLAAKAWTGLPRAAAGVSAVGAARAAATACRGGRPASPVSPPWSIEDQPGWPMLHDEHLGESFPWPPPVWRWAGREGPECAPRIGEHNEEVYGGILGLDAAEIRRLRLKMVL